MTRAIDPQLAAGNRKSAAALGPRHFGWTVERRVGAVTLNHPVRTNPLAFDPHAAPRDLLRLLAYPDDVRAVALQGAGGNFCPGGDVHASIAAPVKTSLPEPLAFARMTGGLVKAMRACPQSAVAAIDGACIGAGAIVAMASDLHVGTARSKVAFPFTRVGLAGCDMGACAILPRIVGQGRASELLYTGRALPGDEALARGLYNRIAEPDAVSAAAIDWAAELAAGPSLGHAMTKRMLHHEWSMGVDEAIGPKRMRRRSA
jgi:enoyl-CoA hydratase/carnithine racemase